MQQVKFVLNDIKNNKLISVSLLFLCIVVMLLLSNLYDVLTHTHENLNKIEYFRNTEAYIVQDSTDELLFEKISSDENAIEKMEKFFTEMRMEQIKFYTQYGYDMYVSEYGNVVRQESVTENFFDLFGIRTVEGRLFEEEEYDEETEIIPVVIGYNLGNEYVVGNVYEFENAGTGEVFAGIVIGRLQKNSEYMEFNNSYEMTYTLDNSYIIPLGLKDYKNDKMSFSDWDMALTSMVIMSDDVTYVAQEIENMGLFKLSLLDIQERFAEVVSAEINYLNMILTFTIVVSILIIFVIWIIFSRYIRKQLYEYGIHLLCGARRKSLIGRNAMYIFFVLGLSSIIVWLLFGSLEDGIFLLFSAVVLGAVIMIYPFCKLRFGRILKIMKID